MPRNLHEGMRGGDLAKTVRPVISVDEYVSKISDKAIVIGFFVEDESAANDLCRFIQRTPIDILDSDISPAPDSSGYFMVFVELLPNDKFSDSVVELCTEVSSLTDNDHWMMKLRGVDEDLPLDHGRLEEFIDTLKKPDPKATMEQAIYDFLRPSLLEHAVIENGFLTLHASGITKEFEIIGFGIPDELMATHQLSEAAIAYDMRNALRSAKLAALLGENWSAHRIGPFDILMHADHNHGLLIRQ